MDRIRMRFSQSVLKESRLQVDVGGAIFFARQIPTAGDISPYGFRRAHMTAIHLQPCDDRPRRPSRHIATDLLGEAARHMLFALRLWRERIRSRNELARLDQRMLADIGVTSSDRDFLVNKPFWRE
jgi:uncharacterized protein YjiS (DUF1127 family)